MLVYVRSYLSVHYHFVCVIQVKPNINLIAWSATRLCLGASIIMID